MSGVKYWIKKGSFSVVNRVLMFLFAFGTYLLLVRYLDKSDFGIYSLYLVIVTFVDMGRKSFLQNSFTKFFLDDSRSKSEVLTSSLILNLFWTGLCATVFLLLGWFIGGIFDSVVLGDILTLYGIATVMQIPSSQIIFFLTANLKFKHVALINNSQNFFFFVSATVIFLFTSGLTVHEIALFHMGGIVFATMFSLFFLNQLRGLKVKVNWEVVKEMFNFGKYTMGIGLTGTVTRSIDQLMIGVFISSEAVASYNIARRFLNILDIPITSISHVAYPKMAKIVNDGGDSSEVARVYEKSSGYGIGVIFPAIAMLMLFPSFFITIVAGEEYLDAVSILQILLVLVLLKPLAIQGGGLMEALGKPKIGFILITINAVLNIGLNYLFINLEGVFGGAMGAAIASFLARLIHLMFLYYFISRESPISILRVVKHAVSVYKIGFKMVLEKLGMRS